MKPRRKRYTPYDKLKVIYRKDSDGKVIAFMPELPANYGKIVCYAHIGQHSEASIEYYHSTTTALPSEYEPLHKELKAIYSDYELSVKRRLTYGDLTEKAWRR
jgi:hypothetical protein